MTADLLQTGSDWLQTQRKAELSHAVTYARGANSVSVNATVGSTTFDVVTDHAVEQVETRDFLITRADLVIAAIGADPIEPARGDKITETVGSETLTYEVMAPNTDEPPYRYSDRYRKTYRVHTKLVTEA